MPHILFTVIYIHLSRQLLCSFKLLWRRFVLADIFQTLIPPFIRNVFFISPPSVLYRLSDRITCRSPSNFISFPPFPVTTFNSTSTHTLPTSSYRHLDFSVLSMVFEVVSTITAPFLSHVISLPFHTYFYSFSLASVRNL